MLECKIVKIEFKRLKVNIIEQTKYEGIENDQQTQSFYKAN